MAHKHIFTTPVWASVATKYLKLAQRFYKKNYAHAFVISQKLVEYLLSAPDDWFSPNAFAVVVTDLRRLSSLADEEYNKEIGGKEDTPNQLAVVNMLEKGLTEMGKQPTLQRAVLHTVNNMIRLYLTVGVFYTICLHIVGFTLSH